MLNYKCDVIKLRDISTKCYYKNTIRSVWLYNEIPIDIIKKLNVTPKNKSIDIIMHSNDNLYYAIQCKFKQNSRNKIKSNKFELFDIDLFNNSKFNKFFFVTNALTINDEIMKLDKLILLHGNFFNDLSSDFFNQLKSILYTNISLPKEIITPIDYHRDIINTLMNNFKENNMGCLYSADKFDNPLISYLINKEMKSKFTLIFLSDRQMLLQFYTELLMLSNNEKYDMDFIIIDSNFYYNGIITTDYANEISEKIIKIIELKKINKKYNNRIVILTTYAYTDTLLTGISLTGFKSFSVSLCIFDNTCISEYNIDKQIKLLTPTPKMIIIYKK